MLDIFQSGSPIEFFVEGGRSRNGLVGNGKYGLLRMVLDMHKTGEVDEVILVPCSVDYDVLPEIKAHVKQKMGLKKQPETLLSLVGLVTRTLMDAIVKLLMLKDE